MKTFWYVYICLFIVPNSKEIMHPVYKHSSNNRALHAQEKCRLIYSVYVDFRCFWLDLPVYDFIEKLIWNIELHSSQMPLNDDNYNEKAIKRYGSLTLRNNLAFWLKRCFFKYPDFKKSFLLHFFHLLLFYYALI